MRRDNQQLCCSVEAHPLHTAFCATHGSSIYGLRCHSSAAQNKAQLVVASSYVRQQQAGCNLCTCQDALQSATCKQVACEAYRTLHLHRTCDDASLDVAVSVNKYMARTNRHKCNSAMCEEASSPSAPRPDLHARDVSSIFTDTSSRFTQYPRTGYDSTPARTPPPSDGAVQST